MYWQEGNSTEKTWTWRRHAIFREIGYQTNGSSERIVRRKEIWTCCLIPNQKMAVSRVNVVKLLAFKHNCFTTQASVHQPRSQTEISSYVAYKQMQNTRSSDASSLSTTYHICSVQKSVSSDKQIFINSCGCRKAAVQATPRWLLAIKCFILPSRRKYFALTRRSHWRVWRVVMQITAPFFSLAKCRGEIRGSHMHMS